MNVKIKIFLLITFVIVLNLYWILLSHQEKEHQRIVDKKEQTN